MFDNLSKDEILDLIKYLDLKSLMDVCVPKEKRNTLVSAFRNDNREVIIERCKRELRDKVFSLEHLSKQEKSLILNQIAPILNNRTTNTTVVPREKIPLIQRFSSLSGYVDNERQFLFKNT